MYDNLFSVELFLCNEHFELHFTHSSIIVFMSIMQLVLQIAAA